MKPELVQTLKMCSTINSGKTLISWLMQLTILVLAYTLINNVPGMLSLC
jgi:hypothetical protein